MVWLRCNTRASVEGAEERIGGRWLRIRCQCGCCLGLLLKQLVAQLSASLLPLGLRWQLGRNCAGLTFPKSERNHVLLSVAEGQVVLVLIISLATVDGQRGACGGIVGAAWLGAFCLF